MNEQFREFLSAQGVDCEDLRPLGEGTSNDTYLLGKALVYREKKPSDPYFYQPLYEKRAIMEGAKKGIAVPALLFDEKTGEPLLYYEKEMPIGYYMGNFDLDKV